MNYVENEIVKPKGHIQMTMFKGDYINGKIQGKILQEYEEHNLIVDVASTFMAARMAPAPSIVGSTPCYQITADPTVDDRGIVTSNTSMLQSTNYPLPAGFQYLALGNGHLTEMSDGAYGEYLYTADTTDTTDAQRKFTTLVHETLRRPITNWAFVDKDYNVSTTETNTLRLTTLVDYSHFPTNQGDLAYWIVEMGLFGGTATGELNSGYMFNYRVFKAWNMIVDSKLLINWYIQF